jgi:hypothetical protein
MRDMHLRDLHLDIPLAIFAAGCIICLLSVLGIFSQPTTQALFEIGAEIGLLGILAGIIVIVWYK